MELRFFIKNLNSESRIPLSEAILPTNSFGKALKEGSLKLKGKRKFKDRYFVLVRTHMMYSHSKKTLEQVTAIFSLTDVIVSVWPTQPVNEAHFGKFTFELITPMKIYILKAISSEEKVEWMKAISDQIAALADRKTFLSINAQIRESESENSDRDIALIETCSDFSTLMSRQESRWHCHRDLLFSFLSAEKRLLIRLMEEYRAECRSDTLSALGLAQSLVHVEILTKLVQVQKHSCTALISEEILSSKLSRFFKFFDAQSRLTGTIYLDLEVADMENLFADVETEVMKVIREVEYPAIITKEEFRNGVLKLPAKRLLLPWRGRETSVVTGRKSRNFDYS